MRSPRRPSGCLRRLPRSSPEHRHVCKCCCVGPRLGTLRAVNLALNLTAELLIPEVEELIRTGNYAELRESMSSMHPADMAEILSALDPKDACLGFRFLPRDLAAEAFSYIPPEQQELIITQLGNEAAVSVLEEMTPDDRARLVDELPEAVAQRLIASLSPETRKVTSIRGRPNMASGRISKPDTRADPASHFGARPAKCSAIAKSSPAVRIVALPHRSTTSPRG